MQSPRLLAGGKSLFAVVACLAAASVAHCGVTSDPKDALFPDAKWVSVKMDENWVTFQIRLTESIFERDGITGMPLHTQASGALDIDADGDATTGAPADPGIDMKFTYSVSPVLCHGSLLFNSGPRKGQMESVGLGGTGCMRISAKDADVFLSFPTSLLGGNRRFRYVLWSGATIDIDGGDRVPNRGLASSQGDGAEVDTKEPVGPSNNPFSGGLPPGPDYDPKQPLPPLPPIILPPPPPGFGPMPSTTAAANTVTLKAKDLGDRESPFDDVTTCVEDGALVWKIHLWITWPDETTNFALMLDTDQKASTGTLGSLVRGVAFNAERAIMIRGGQTETNQKKLFLTGALAGETIPSVELARQVIVTRGVGGYDLTIKVPMSALGVSTSNVNWMLAFLTDTVKTSAVFGKCAVCFPNGQVMFADVLNMF